MEKTKNKEYVTTGYLAVVEAMKRGENVLKIIELYPNSIFSINYDIKNSLSYAMHNYQSPIQSEQYRQINYFNTAARIKDSRNILNYLNSFLDTSHDQIYLVQEDDRLTLFHGAIRTYIETGHNTCNLTELFNNRYGERYCFSWSPSDNAMVKAPREIIKQLSIAEIKLTAILKKLVDVDLKLGYNPLTNRVEKNYGINSLNNKEWKKQLKQLMDDYLNAMNILESIVKIPFYWDTCVYQHEVATTLYRLCVALINTIRYWLKINISLILEYAVLRKLNSLQDILQHAVKYIKGECDDIENINVSTIRASFNIRGNDEGYYYRSSVVSNYGSEWDSLDRLFGEIFLEKLNMVIFDRGELNNIKYNSKNKLGDICKNLPTPL